jgi:hypothetical protein
MMAKKRMRWAWNVARMGNIKNAYKVLVRRHERKRPLVRYKRRWEDNIKVDLKEIGYEGLE